MRETGIRFGEELYPPEIATGHFLEVGTTGSGKTMILRLLMQSALPQIGPGSDHRALLYDAQGNLLSVLAGMRLRCPVRIVNPFDARSAAWAMARDVTTVTAALQLATTLIPEEAEGNTRFFSDAARHLLTGLFVALMLTAPGEWKFWEAILIARDRRYLKQVLARHPATAHLLAYFSARKTFNDILTTMMTKLAPMEPIAAAWSKAKESFSVREWAGEGSVLYLGNDESIHEAHKVVNQLIIRRAQETCLSQPESSTRRTWMFLDELPSLGKLDGLVRAMLMGRSKGLVHCLGVQAIESLQRLYTREGASEILGQCGNKAILRLESPETAKWASEMLGEWQGVEYRRSWTSGPGGESVSDSEQVVKREAVLPSQFLSFPVTNPHNGLTGVFIVPLIGAFQATISGEFITDHLLPPDRAVANFIPRPDTDQFLLPFTDEDLKRLGLQRPAQRATNQQSIVRRRPKEGK